MKKEPNAPVILVLTEKEEESRTFSNVLTNLGCKVIVENTLSQGLSRMETEYPIHIVLLSHSLSDVPFPDSVSKIRQVNGKVPMALLLDKDDGEKAFSAMRLGCFDCLSPPFHLNKIMTVVGRGLFYIGLMPAWFEEESTEEKKSTGLLHKNRLWLGLGFVLVCGLVSFGLYHSYTIFKRQTFKNSEMAIDLPYAYPTAMSWDGEKIWICDWLNQTVYRHTPEPRFPIEKVYRLALINPNLIAKSPGTLWVIATDKKTYQFSLNGSPRLIYTSDTSAKMSVTGIAWDGRFLWFLDNAGPRLHFFDTTEIMTLRGNYTLPKREYSGLCWDGRSFWSTLPVEKKIVRFRIDNHTFQEELSLPIALLTEKNLKPINILHDGFSVWLVFDDNSEILKIPEQRVVSLAKR